LREGIRPVVPVTVSANLMLAMVEGRIAQYVRSDFKRSPTDHWALQWSLLNNQIFHAHKQRQVQRDRDTA
jgi:TetR/AcrR family transcriptional regulator